jgi:O-antigen/teichoic acid export membrane protein
VRALIARGIPVALNQASTLLLGLASIRLISELVPPSVYGLYVLFLTLTQLGPMLVHSPEINHAARFWQREQRSRSGYPRFVWAVIWRKGAYLAPLLALCCVSLALYGRNPVWLWVWPLLFLGNIAASLLLLAQNGLNAVERRWTVFWLGLIGQVGRIVFPVGLVLLAGASLLQLALGYGLQALVGLAVVGVLLCCASQGAQIATLEQRSSWTVELRAYGRPYIVLGIGAWFLQNLDRWLVALFFGAQSAGQFGLAIGIAGAIPLLLLGGLMQLVFPAAFRAADRASTLEDWRRLARKCDLISAVFLVLTIVGLLLLRWAAPYLIGWLIAPKYEPALALLLAAGCSALTASALQLQYLLLQGQAKSMEMVKVMSTVATIKIAVCIAAAFVSFSAFLIALVLMMPISFFIGRGMIRSMALGASVQHSSKSLPAAQEIF